MLLIGFENNHQTIKDTTDMEQTIFESVNNFDGVTMTLKEETVSSTGLTLLLENASSNECVYGEWFRLEKKIEESWYRVPVATDGNYAFISIGYDLNPSERRKWEVDWEWIHGSLETGDYRIVKDILDFRKAGDFDKYYLAAEFTIY